MILILASAFDEQARMLAERWHGSVITPADLSTPGWLFELPGRGRNVAVAAGQTIPVREITGVLNRLEFVWPRDLPEVAAEDRQYVAAEMRAFLTAWLDSLACPVLNRPAPDCLCGAASRLPEGVDIGQGGEHVFVVGDKCIGAPGRGEADEALQIARKAGAELLEVLFRSGTFVSAGLIPDLSREDVIAAVYQRLTSKARKPGHPRDRARIASGRSTILLWGLPADSPLGRVHEELRKLDAPVRLLDQRDVLETTVTGSQVTVRGRSFSMDEAKSIYLRCYDSTRLPHIRGASEESRRHAAEVDARLTRLVGASRAFVVSPLAAMAVNDSKPYQSRRIARLGWRIPKTLVTTDPAAAGSFWKRHGEVVYKSVSSVRSQVSRLGPEHEVRFENIVTCPTQFQEHIAGVDYRVHVVGDEIFACQVESDADDYRYGGSHYTVCQLPAEVADRCRRMSAEMRLPVSGIDLRLTPDGDWVCFEVNPSPGFTAYEEVTGQPIAAAVARLLADGGGLAAALSGSPHE